MFSYAKAEKVVNPPQNPVANNMVKLDGLLEYLSDNSNTIPMMKQPMILTVKVAIGKVVKDFC